MIQTEALREAARAVAQLVIELHCLAGAVRDEVAAQRIRKVADALSDIERGLRVTGPRPYTQT